jgi:hypothetical protein
VGNFESTLLLDVLLSSRWANILQKPLFAGSNGEIVLSSLIQAQMTIRPSAHRVCVVFILTVIFPEANGTYIVPAPFRQGKIAATRALV